MWHTRQYAAIKKTINSDIVMCANMLSNRNGSSIKKMNKHSTNRLSLGEVSEEEKDGNGRTRKSKGLLGGTKRENEEEQMLAGVGQDDRRF
jgi:hypothetical protein